MSLIKIIMDHCTRLYVDIFRTYLLLKILDDAFKSSAIIHIDRFKRENKGLEKCTVPNNMLAIYKSIPLFNACIGKMVM